LVSVFSLSYGLIQKVKSPSVLIVTVLQFTDYGTVIRDNRVCELLSEITELCWRFRNQCIIVNVVCIFCV